MSLRKEAVGKLEEESRAWEEARQALESQVSQKSFKSFPNCPHVHLFPPELSSQCKLLQVRSLQTSSKLAEEAAVSREQIHKQEVRAGLFKYFGVFQHFISN